MRFIQVFPGPVYETAFGPDGDCPPIGPDCQLAVVHRTNGPDLSDIAVTGSHRLRQTLVPGVLSVLDRSHKRPRAGPNPRGPLAPVEGVNMRRVLVVMAAVPLMGMGVAAAAYTPGSLVPASPAVSPLAGCAITDTGPGVKYPNTELEPSLAINPTDPLTSWAAGSRTDGRPAPQPVRDLVRVPRRSDVCNGSDPG